MDDVTVHQLPARPLEPEPEVDAQLELFPTPPAPVADLELARTLEPVRAWVRRIYPPGDQAASWALEAAAALLAGAPPPPWPGRLKTTGATRLDTIRRLLELP